jgi:O-methyltransferase involved in polyketide biosynthesis
LHVADLAITALYTSGVWTWAKLPGAELLASRDADRVFAVTNAALAFARRKPPLRDALLARHRTIDAAAREAARVVELAAGLSPRGAELCARAEYIEIDTLAMIAKKRELLGRTPEGRAVLERLQLVAGDATALELEPLAPPGTLVIAEGLCMYLPPAARRALAARLAACPGVRFVFDLVPAREEPSPGLAGRVLAAAMKRATGGATIERDLATRDDVIAELRAAGFASACAIAGADEMAVFSATSPGRRS